MLRQIKLRGFIKCVVVRVTVCPRVMPPVECLVMGMLRRMLLVLSVMVLLRIPPSPLVLVSRARLWWTADLETLTCLVRLLMAVEFLLPMTFKTTERCPLVSTVSSFP